MRLVICLDSQGVQEKEELLSISSIELGQPPT